MSVSLVRQRVFFTYLLSKNYNFKDFKNNFARFLRFKVCVATFFS
jgi:hypothetical protein